MKTSPTVTYTEVMDWRYALFAGLTLLITAIVGYGSYTTARLLRHWQPQENLLLLPAENVLRGIILVICLLLGRGSGLPPETLGWQFTDAGSQIVTGALAGLGLAVLFVGMGRFVTRYTDTRFYRSILGLVVPRDRREAGLLPFALLLSVLFEEVLFRSLLIGGLSPLLPTTWLIFGFSVLFGLLHSPQGVWGIVGAGTAGAIFGFMFVWQQSLLTPLVAHFVANGVQIWLASRELGPSSNS
ncbi:MAG: CPBP family intramembrane metalloprotease [Caldilineaceae bacterium]|nr:CPBP family intramembrane metalloprotease [Caldilineaceae bacterium]